VIKTAMVMAAGHGTRLRPLTSHMSKAMVEVGGKPLIDHMLDRLLDAGVERTVVNLHAHADRLEAHLKTRTSGPEIIISDERDALLGTGGGVVKALPLLGDDAVLICNVDALWLEFEPAIKSLVEKLNDGMSDLLLLAPLEHTLGYAGAGDFDMNADGRLHRRRGDHASYVYCGVQIARPERFKTYPAASFSRGKIWDVSLRDGLIYGHVLKGFWMHVGDPGARDGAEYMLRHHGEHKYL